METGRLEAFSDGVFAIAITLLIIEVSLPEGHGPLAERLLDAWPSYVAYLISFVTIGIMWANHHGIFQLIDRTTHGLVVANLLLLLLVAFIPFPTKILGEHLQGALDERRTAALFYNGTFFVTAIFYNTLWQTAAWKNRLIVQGREAAAAQVTRRYWAGSPSYLVATLAAFWSVPLSIALNGAIAFFYLLPRRAGAEAPSRAERTA
jgi:uncharacterized membrane protein